MLNMTELQIDTTNKYRYCDLSNEEIIKKCQAIENSSMTFDEKVKEFDAIGFSRTYDIIGDSYCLFFPDTLRIFTRNYNIRTAKITRDITLYKPTDHTLPSIEIHYDYGLVMDFIGCGRSYHQENNEEKNNIIYLPDKPFIDDNMDSY